MNFKDLVLREQEKIDERKSIQTPLESPRENSQDIEYCYHNEIYPNQSLLVGVCKYCAGNELGEHLRPLRERREREIALEKEKSDAKRLGKKWTKPKPPKSPVKIGEVCPQWYDNSSKEEIKKLTLKVLYNHAERTITTKRKISLSVGINSRAGTHGHIISPTVLEGELHPFRAILQTSLDKGCVMTVIKGVFMVIPEDWVRHSKW